MIKLMSKIVKSIEYQRSCPKLKKLLLHKVVYKTARIFIMPYIKCRFRFQFEKVLEKNKPYMVLANHTSAWDPIFVGMSFPDHMYYVASEHIFRKGFLSKLLNIFLAPIMRVKARTEMRTAMCILKTLKSGCNVCMFPEGSSSWNGETAKITPSTAKLVKHSGATLITYRLEGSYLSLPRWAKTIRRGKMRGYPVHKYNSEELLKMTEEEVELTINKDLYVNAYTNNEKEPVMYHGKGLAENLETALYVCPSCGGLTTLKSKGDLIECTCGLSLRYNTYGFFESMTSEKAPFKTILEWDKWQRNHIEKKGEYYRSLPINMPIISDVEQYLYQFEAGGSTKLIGSGTLSLFSDRLVLEDSLTGNNKTFQLCQITDMALIQQTLMSFTVGGKDYYEIKSNHPRSGLKYLMLCNCLTELRIML
ncbi:MAG: phospholipid/glycerol acyltransferase [Clostridiales bacterium]|nr:phospholipid/glycerol acyltransferase [Clostridiales bacterium]